MEILCINLTTYIEMYTCICIYVYIVYMCNYYIYIYIYICIYTQLFIYIYILTYVYIHVYMCTVHSWFELYSRIYKKFAVIPMLYIRLSSLPTNTRVYIYIWKNVYNNVHMYIYIPIYTHIHIIYIYIYIYIPEAVLLLESATNTNTTLSFWTLPCLNTSSSKLQMVELIRLQPSSLKGNTLRIYIYTCFIHIW